MSDIEVAAKLGVSVGYVRFVRTNEGIPAFDERTDLDPLGQ